jgi:hypothetical protein
MSRSEYAVMVIEHLLNFFNDDQKLNRLGVHVINHHKTARMLEEGLYVMYGQESREVIENWLYHDEGRLVKRNGKDFFINDIQQFVNFLEAEFMGNEF